MYKVFGWSRLKHYDFTIMKQQHLFFRLRFGKTEKVYSLEFISNFSFQPQVKIDQLALKYLSSIFYFWNEILLFWQFEMLFSISLWSWIIVLDEPLFFKQAYSILNKNLFSFLVFRNSMNGHWPAERLTSLSRPSRLSEQKPQKSRRQSEKQVCPLILYCIPIILTTVLVLITF
jgi:hypothetical protein